MTTRSYPLLGSLSEVESTPAKEASAFALLRSCDRKTTSKGQPFCDLTLSDAEASVAGKIWDDARAAMDAVATLRPGVVVKIAFRVDSYRGAPQLAIQELRVARPDDEGYDVVALFGEVPDWLPDLTCRTLVFDIETVPDAELRELPQTIVKSLTEHAERRELDQAMVMALSPFFGKVVSLAFGEGESEPDEQSITALVVPPPDQPAREFPDWIRPVDEAELLRAFWALAAAAETVVSYNGRRFDVPFLTGRSLMHGIPARVDLASSRWSLRPHLDLFEILGQQGRGPSNLDVVCWALGIESPKGAMDGSMVAPAYQSGEIVEIAEYNRHDVRATTAVYQRARELVLRYRRDWTG